MIVFPAGATERGETIVVANGVRCDAAAFRIVRRDRTFVLVVGADAHRPQGLLTLRDLVEELHAAARVLPAARSIP